MLDAKVMKKAVTRAAIEAAKAIVLAMTEANEESRMPTTGTREANLGEVARSRASGPSLHTQYSTRQQKIRK